MLSSEAPLLPRGALASRTLAAVGWVGSGVSIAEKVGLSLALTLARAERLAPLRAAFYNQFEIELPRDLHAIQGPYMTVVSCGPGAYLAASPVGPNQTSVANVRRCVGDFATVLDYSDHLAVLTVEGPRSPDLLARMCAVDLACRELPSQLGIVTLICQVRTYLWRLAPAGPFWLAVPRSLAVGFWDALLLIAQSSAGEEC